VAAGCHCGSLFPFFLIPLFFFLFALTHCLRQVFLSLNWSLKAVVQRFACLLPLHNKVQLIFVLTPTSASPPTPSRCAVYPLTIADDLRAAVYSAPLPVTEYPHSCPLPREFPMFPPSRYPPSKATRARLIFLFVSFVRFLTLFLPALHGRLSAPVFV